MRTHACVLGIVGAALAMAACLAGSNAADKNSEREATLKLAEAIEKGDGETAQKLVAALKEEELQHIMKLFKPREKDGKGGIGFGPKPGNYKLDGIELQLRELGKKPLSKQQIDGQAEDIAKAAYIVAAVASVAQHKCPVVKKEDDKDPKEWKQWSENLRTAALELAKAARAREADKVKTVASKINSTCSACHVPFRE